MTELSFLELFNARCTELGLLDAAEIAARIERIHPAMRGTDLTRTVRNWQAGRNVPRSDFYRIILDALEIDGPDRRALWHRAYRESKARARTASTAPAGQDAGTPVESPPEPERERVGAPAHPAGRQPSRPRRGSPMRWHWLLAGLAGLVLIGALASRQIAIHVAGRACDGAAGANWDPQRGPRAEPQPFRDIRAEAIEACEEAVRLAPGEGRFWFQLGRAHERDARWHGDHAAAFWALRRASELGHVAASLSLGMLHEDGRTRSRPGDGSKPDLRGAAHHYAKAAEGGLPMGLYCHAIATLFGWQDGHPDAAAAIRSAKAAVAAGSRRALGLVADLEARAPSTRHVACARERGDTSRFRSIAWQSGGPDDSS